jgi:hypothetical protein
MTNVGIFEEAKKGRTIKKLRARVKDLLAINKEHQMMHGKLHSELEIERKNHTLTREGNDLLNRENGRLMKKLKCWKAKRKIGKKDAKSN